MEKAIAVALALCLAAAALWADQERLRLATTTSTENSGLLNELIPPFERFTYFRTGAGTLRCPAQEGPFSTAVLPVEDVILSREKIHTSAQNQFLGTVTEVKKINHMARVSLDCGFAIQALITT